MVKFRGHPENVSFLQFPQNIDGSDKMIYRALELMLLYKQNSLENFFIFYIYQNYTLALINIFFFLTAQHGTQKAGWHVAAEASHLELHPLAVRHPPRRLWLRGDQRAPWPAAEDVHQDHRLLSRPHHQEGLWYLLAGLQTLREGESLMKGQHSCVWTHKPVVGQVQDIAHSNLSHT